MLDHPAVTNGVANQSTNSDHPPTPAGLTITEAAEQCGVTREAIRLRIRRGKLPAEKVDGQWVVFLNTSPTPTTNHVGGPNQPVGPHTTTNTDENTVPYPVLVHQMESEIAFLREQLTAQQRQLEEAAQERSELRQLLALQVTQALPEPRPAEAPQPALTTEPTAVHAEERQRRWWWPFGV